MNFLVKAWYQKKSWLYLLLPLTAIYALGALVHKRWMLSRIKHLPVPVIVVGNLTVGGTGKTPLVIEIVRFLQKQGYCPGIISRGYRGKSNKIPSLVTQDSDPHLVGDEPLLMARQTGCPVVIGRDRAAAAHHLLEISHCNVIVSDDGLQHYVLARNIEIVVIDQERRLGNGLCLPSGPLREPLSRLSRVDFIVSNGATISSEREWKMQFMIEKIVNVIEPQKKWSNDFKGVSIHAVAGIGNTQRFFTQLKRMGFHVIEHSFPDHYVYQRQDIDFNDKLKVIMTDKDAVKCEKIADQRHWRLSIKAVCDPLFFISLNNKLEQVNEEMFCD